MGPKHQKILDCQGHTVQVLAVTTNQDVERLKAELENNGKEIGALKEKASTRREGETDDTAARATTFKTLLERFYLSPLS
jgi:hypothetical protein